MKTKAKKESKKDILANGKQKNEAEEMNLSNLPKLQTFDRSRQECMAKILSRNDDSHVIEMDELNILQRELEEMLSTTAMNYRALHCELYGPIESIKNDTQGFNKKRKLNDSKVKEIKREKEIKLESSSSEEEEVEEPSVEVDSSSDQKKEPKKKVVNEHAIKFWASIQPYVSNITEENVKDVEDFIQTCDDDIAIKIPPLGQHYTAKWADEDLGEEKQCSAGTGRIGKNSPSSESDSVGLLRKATAMCSDRSPGPIVQRIVSALLEEPPHDNFNNKLSDENDSLMYLSKLPLYHTTPSFERRLRRELEIVGLLDTNDYNEDTDEVLAEIKKCQEELKAVSAVNKEHLTRLLGEMKSEMKKQEIKKKIHSVDKEIIEIHSQIAMQKIKQPLNKKNVVSSKERDEAWRLLKLRETLIKSLDF